MTTKDSTRKRRSWLAVALLVVCLIVVFPLRRALQLSADPVGPKDCGPIENGDAGPASETAATSDGEACLVSRNHPMHDSVAYLRNRLPAETDILHEYFVPQDRFVAFVDGLRSVMLAHAGKLLNASVRVVHRESNALSYAPRDNMLAIVLYLNQATDREGNERMARLTGALIDVCSENGGRFFLPYQLHYTAAQLTRAYPEIVEFFAAKRALDPDGLFTNVFYEKYGATGS